MLFLLLKFISLKREAEFIIMISKALYGLTSTTVWANHVISLLGLLHHSYLPPCYSSDMPNKLPSGGLWPCYTCCSLYFSSHSPETPYLMPSFFFRSLIKYQFWGWQASPCHHPLCPYPALFFLIKFYYPIY